MKDHSRSASIGALIPQSTATPDATVIPAISSKYACKHFRPQLFDGNKNHSHVCFHEG
jgi:hypothetical protein